MRYNIMMVVMDTPILRSVIRIPKMIKTNKANTSNDDLHKHSFPKRLRSDGAARLLSSLNYTRIVFVLMDRDIHRLIL